LLADQASRIRMDAIRLCRETDETLRRSANLRVQSEWLRGEFGHELVRFVANLRPAAHICRGAAT